MANRIAILSLLFPLVLAFHCLAEEAAPEFLSEIQPLFADRCGKCHRASVQKGDLDLSSLQAIRTGGESGEALIADSLEESRLWQVVQDGEMPPADEPALNLDEIELIKRWIESDQARSISGSMVDQSVTLHDVMPIVLLRCNTCHGPRLREGGLDLRTRAGMLRGGKQGPALVPGDADASLMVQRIESEACPPRELLLKYFVRRPSSSEIKLLRQWIDQGALIGETNPDVASSAADPLVSDEDRTHWAFQPPEAPPSGDSIDDFVLDRMKAAGVKPSAMADRDTLIRRVHLDLLGMPPSLEQWRYWRSHPDAGWYEQMVDQTLASPHYGERWGRYWLDLAGYADSEGGISADPIRKVAWKYRDYVIDAFNEDKPYDRFLMEQLAGDELLDFEQAETITEEMVQNLIATGFLRMGIDETGSRTMNFVPERLKVISDAITVVSSGLMGLTIECARCHSHKYDPIPQRDYYRLKAVFQGALDEHDWSSFKNRQVSFGTASHRARIAKINPPLEKQIKGLLAKQKQLIAELNLGILRHHHPKQSEEDNRATLAALKIADNNRTLPQKHLVERLQLAELLPDSRQSPTILETRTSIAAIDRQIYLLRRRLVAPLTIRALWDFGRPSPTYILRRGEHDKAGQLVGPGVPAVLTDGSTPFQVDPPFPTGTPKTGRRLAFARWLTQADHPLTSRVMVNRIWYHHFGTGLVKTLDNFGAQGARPSHPELLDWLAIEFVRRGWSIKAVHRLILNSQTYRRSSRVTDEQLQLDPQNQLYSRMPMLRLDAESLRDSLLFVSGRLDTEAGGIPDVVRVNRDGLVSVEATQGGGWRRSVYAQYRRTEIPTMMDTFDYPQMGPNCSLRSISNVSSQSLLLMNNGHVHELAKSLARRIDSMLDNPSEATDDDRIDLVYQVVLSRMPDRREREVAKETLRELKIAWGGAGERALETFCHAILNSAAFLYVD